MGCPDSRTGSRFPSTARRGVAEGPVVRSRSVTSGYRRTQCLLTAPMPAPSRAPKAAPMAAPPTSDAEGGVSWQSAQATAPAMPPPIRPTRAPMPAPLPADPRCTHRVSIVMAATRNGSGFAGRTWPATRTGSGSAISTSWSGLRSSRRPSYRPATCATLRRTHWLSARLSKAVCRSVTCCAAALPRGIQAKDADSRAVMTGVRKALPPWDEPTERVGKRRPAQLCRSSFDRVPFGERWPIY